MRIIFDTMMRLGIFGLAEDRKTAPHVDRLTDLAAFGTNPGFLQARVHFPPGLPTGAPLVVVLHGCSQTAAEYDQGAGWSTIADRYGFALLFAQQRRYNNPNLCFNWFSPEDSRRDSGEARSIFEMIDTVVGMRDLDRTRIFVTGLSAGGAMAMVMLAVYPEVFAGGAIIAGLPFGVATTPRQAFDRMRGHGGPAAADLGRIVEQASPHAGPWPMLSIWHGTADNTVSASNSAAILEQWRTLHGLGAAPTRSEVVDGHARRVWCDTEGCERIEAFTIRGMGHGTPLDTGLGGCGQRGDYMLDVRVSSTKRIAGFWGLVPAGGQVTVAREMPSAAGPRGVGASRAHLMPQAV